MSIKKILFKLLPFAIIFAIGYFFSQAIIENWHSISKIDLQPDVYSIAGTLFFLIAVIISGVLWGKLLSELSGKKIGLNEAIKVHSASWLMKYIPGQAGSILSKLAWAKSNGISQKSATNSFIYENVLLVLASAVLALPVIVLFQGALSSDPSLLLPLLIIIPISLVVYKPFFYKSLNFIFLKIGRKPFRESDFLTSKQILKFLSLYLLPRAMNGVAFVLIALSFLPVESSMFVGLASIYILASVVGLLAIFVPGGIGVREAVIVLFASAYFPVDIAVLLSLIARFYATIADIGVGITYLLMNKGRIS